MLVAKGYGGKPTSIRIYARFGAMAELEIEQEGQPRYAESINGKITRIPGGTETLAYISLQEMINLRNELNVAIKQTAGV